jgi:hypothetical protein
LAGLPSERQLEVGETGRGTVIALRDGVLFDFGMADIRRGARLIASGRARPLAAASTGA